MFPEFLDGIRTHTVTLTHSVSGKDVSHNLEDNLEPRFEYDCSGEGDAEVDFATVSPQALPCAHERCANIFVQRLL